MPPKANVPGAAGRAKRKQHIQAAVVRRSIRVANFISSSVDFSRAMRMVSLAIRPLWLRPERGGVTITNSLSMTLAAVDVYVYG